MKWTWTDDKPVDNPKKFMLSASQDYINQLYNSGDEQLPYMKMIAETVLKYYPDNVESLSDISITYILNNDYAKALDYLLKAEQITPTDYIVLNNIAFCYNGQGDKINAIKYYELTEKYGDSEAKAQARQKLAQLRKNK